MTAAIDDAVGTYALEYTVANFYVNNNLFFVFICLFLILLWTLNTRLPYVRLARRSQERRQDPVVEAGQRGQPADPERRRPLTNVTVVVSSRCTCSRHRRLGL